VKRTIAELRHALDTRKTTSQALVEEMLAMAQDPAGEGGRVFLLYRSRTRFQIIPKHAFADTSAIDAFRDLLRRRISGRKA